MRRSIRNLIGGLSAAVIIAVVCCALVLARGASPEKILAALAQATPASHVAIEYPLDETLFPPEIPPPLFRWEDQNGGAKRWLIAIEFADGRERLNALVKQSPWRPETSIWEQIKKRSLDRPATVAIIGVNRWRPSKIVSAGRITIATSSDEVGAPLFYREVNLPFADAVRDPSRIRWRFGAISSAQPPPIVLENLPVCGNCHSFSADGSVLGMDIDYANDKGSYALAAVQEQMTFDKSTIITWGDYQRAPGEVTYGLLSQVSPSGRFVVSTVKDESVFVPKPGMDFSQLFFPVKGILCVYDRQTGVFQSLPGADDPRLVQSNPTWSPDGKYIVFAATEAHHLRTADNARKVLLSPEECREFLEEGKPFKFNLYRVPFNEGQGGKAEPLAGASFNGVSNYFPRYSPDGKWIVFCQAANYMLLQPDSELYIIPAGGGVARRLRANTTRMNSWHSFSPNGKWLVFSGKPDSPYTKLYLTHIDGNGESTPAAALDHLTSPDRAANIPEFVNLRPTAICRIREQFLDDLSYVRGAWEFLKSNDYEGAERQARKALELNPKNGDALYYLGLALFGRQQTDEALRYLSDAVKIKPTDSEIQTQLGVVLLAKGRWDEAVSHLQQALLIAPDNANAYFNLGIALSHKGDKQEAMKCWQKTVQLKPNDHEAHLNLAMALSEQGSTDKAIEHYRKVVQLKPDHATACAGLGMALCTKRVFTEGVPLLSRAVDLDPNNTTIRYNLAVTLARVKRHDLAIAHWQQILKRDPRNAEVLLCLGISYAETGQRDKAFSTLNQALAAAQSTRNNALAGQITGQIELYKQSRPPAPTGR